MLDNSKHPLNQTNQSFLSELHKYIERDKAMKRASLRRNTMDPHFKEMYLRQQTMRHEMNVGNFRHITDSLIREADLSMEEFSRAIGYKKEELELFIQNGIVSRALHDAILEYFEVNPHDSLWVRYIHD